MTKYETCVECGGRTGRAGHGDDSIYDEIGNGPYCEDCYSAVADLDQLARERSSQLGALRADNDRLREALERIAKYGEDHIGYVNAEIDGMPVSRFARTALAKAAGS